MENNQDKIDSFIRNELTKREYHAFEDSLKTDLSLKSDFELTTLISKSLNKRASLYNQMTQWEEELRHKETTKKDHTRLKKIIITGIGLAASVIIGFYVIVPLIDSDISESNDFYAYNLPYFDSSDFKSSDYKIYTSRIDSLIPISKYDEAMSIINLLEKDFEVVTSQQKNEFERAGIEESERTDSQKYLNDLYALQWRKINLLIALGNKQKALELLKKFKDNKGKYKLEAEKLYDNLSRN